MNYLKQIWFDMRHQKMMTWVAVSGTAVSVFLVMVMFMVNNLKTVGFAPDYNRDRIYTAQRMTVKSTDENIMWSNGGRMSYKTVMQLFGDLDGVELLSVCGGGTSETDLIVKDKNPLSVSMKSVDGNYWKMFDFRFLRGRAFTEDECLGEKNLAVIAESVARKVFSSIDVVGRTINLEGTDFEVTGVVADVNPILQNAWAGVYTSLSDKQRKSGWSRGKMLGSCMALMLYREDVDPEKIRREVESRYATLNETMKDNRMMVEYEGAPFSAEEVYITDQEEGRPDLKKEHQREYLLYLILLLLPAINLSSMMRGRLQHRISELGVRRAFGARRRDIIRQLFGENLVVTLIGGGIGLVLSYLFMMTLSSEFFIFVADDYGLTLENKIATPSFGMLFTWDAFFVAVGACLVLNLLTATVPAWRASIINPAVAIAKSKN
ncbi:MAG: FtsX-like permease family protein [Bacteroides sp.]|nr:FtsX-like permease family protein [Bacteroides sp.]